MHTCANKLAIIGSDNGLPPPGRHEAIIWTIAGTSLIWPVVTNFSDISIGIQTFSLKKMHLKMSSAKWHQFCCRLNVLNIVFCTVILTCIYTLILKIFSIFSLQFIKCEAHQSCNYDWLSVNLLFPPTRMPITLQMNFKRIFLD